MQIRRNAHKKIQALADRAIRVTRYDHGEMGVNQELEGAERQVALDDWFEWTRQGFGQVLYTDDSVRLVPTEEGREARRQTILHLYYHQNLALAFVLDERSSEPAG
jgi:hypothetical protein